jgi:hypothetical protein
MDTFQAYYAGIHDPGWQSRIAAQLRDRGLVTFSGITGHEALVAVARRLMTVRPHRDAGPDSPGDPLPRWPECSWVTDQLRPRRSANQDSAANTGAASPSSSAVPVTALSRKPLPTRATPK